MKTRTWYVITRFGRLGGYVPKEKLEKLKCMIPDNLKQGAYKLVSDARLSLLPSALEKKITDRDGIILITDEKISYVPLVEGACEELKENLKQVKDNEITSYQVIYRMLNKGD